MSTLLWAGGDESMLLDAIDKSWICQLAPQWLDQRQKGFGGRRGRNESLGACSIWIRASFASPCPKRPSPPISRAGTRRRLCCHQPANAFVRKGEVQVFSRWKRETFHVENLVGGVLKFMCEHCIRQKAFICEYSAIRVMYGRYARPDWMCYRISRYKLSSNWYGLEILPMSILASNS